MPGETARLTVRVEHDTRDWVVKQAEERGVSMGKVFEESVRYYRAAIEAGHIQVTRKPAKPQPDKNQEKRMPRKKAKPALVKLSGTPALVDRAECGACGKQVGVHSETSLLADHVVHPNVRTKGEYKLCEGSGQAPAGPIVHSAQTDWRRV